MSEVWQNELEHWREFYLLVGTAGAALVGLMFVVVSLRPLLLAAQPTSVRAFCTPIIINFTTAMVVSALMMVPSFSSVLLALALAGLGVAGLIYQFRTGAHSLWRENKLPVID